MLSIVLTTSIKSMLSTKHAWLRDVNSARNVKRGDLHKSSLPVARIEFMEREGESGSQSHMMHMYFLNIVERNVIESDRDCESLKEAADVAEEVLSL